jgi:hypothetical protein
VKALREEFGVLLSWLREPALWALLGLALAAWALAYQWPYAPRLAIGGDLEARTRRFDEPYLRGFNASEPEGGLAADGTRVEWWQLASAPGSFAYRWAESEAAVYLPGLGGGPWALALTASSGRPDGDAVESLLRAGAHEQRLTVVAGHPRRYRLLLPALPSGDLELTITTPRLAAPGDPRDLGLIVGGVALAPLAAGPRAPAWSSLGLLATALLLGYGTLRRLDLAPRWVGLALGVTALGAAGALALARLPLTIFAPTLPGLALACYALAALLARLPWLAKAAALLVVVGSALRLGGVLHPHAIFSDLGLNTNNLRGLLRGEVLISEGLPAEAGGGQAPYPPGQYVLLAPLLLLFGTNAGGLDLATQATNALLDASVAALIWSALGRGGFPARAALLGGALYLLPPPLLRAFSIGEFANIFGQAAAMAALLIPLAGREAPRALPLAALLALALLSHLGVSISLACTFAALLLVLAGAGPQGRRWAWRLILGGVLAGGFVLLAYYSAYGALLSERLASQQAGEGSGTGEALTRLGARTVRELRVGGTLYPLAVMLGVVGLALAARPRVGLPALLAAWWLGTALSLGLLLVARQGVRWEHFLYPALALGGGIALAASWRRGPMGRLAALAALAATLWYGGELWYNQLRAYLH